MNHLTRKSSILLTLTVSVLVSCKPTPESTVELTAPAVETIGYDSIKAQTYGADEYGMKKYVIAFLKRGPNQGQDSTEAANLQRAHMDNINRLAEEGTLVMAGPFFGTDDLRGLYIFDVQSLGAADSLTRTDPAIQAGRLTMELKEWYGSAALMEMSKIHDQIAKVKI